MPDPARRSQWVVAPGTSETVSSRHCTQHKKRGRPIIEILKRRECQCLGQVLAISCKGEVESALSLPLTDKKSIVTHELNMPFIFSQQSGDGSFFHDSLFFHRRYFAHSL